MNVRRVMPLKDEVFFCNFICKRYIFYFFPQILRIITEIVALLQQTKRQRQK